jgi:hypothetical protein
MSGGTKTKIAKDKLYHLIAAMLIAWMVLLASHLWFPLHYNWDFGLAFAVALMCTAAKELIWDKWWGLGTPDPYDFLWGFVGAVVGPALWMVVEMIIGKAEPLPW